MAHAAYGVVFSPSRAFSSVTPGNSRQMSRLRVRLERERERARRSLEALLTETESYRQRVGERDPCAYRSPAAAREEAEQAARSELQARTEQTLQQVDEALERLEQDPTGFLRCERCQGSIAPERLELIPQTRLCVSCLGGAGR